MKYTVALNSGHCKPCPNWIQSSDPVFYVSGQILVLYHILWRSSYWDLRQRIHVSGAPTYLHEAWSTRSFKAAGGGDSPLVIPPSWTFYFYKSHLHGY